jgi:general secretion pathway protein I
VKKIRKNKIKFQRGFSLLEILVAFSILSIMLGILLNIFSSGVRIAHVTGNYATAVQIAESLMAKVNFEIALQESQQQGIIDDLYQWQVTIEDYIPDVEEWEPESNPVQLYKVLVNVSWQTGQKERSFVLTSLRLGTQSVPEL